MRDACARQLTNCEVETAISYPLGLLSKNVAYLGWKKGDFPELNARRAQRSRYNVS